MAELTKEMEALRASYRDNSSTHSGEHSTTESNGSESGRPVSAAADMAKVQKCQNRIQQLEKEA